MPPIKECVGPHSWIIDSQNIGHCRNCPAQKDFGLLQKGKNSGDWHYQKRLSYQDSRRAPSSYKEGHRLAV